MVNNISKDELNLLAWLHEHANGYDDNYYFAPPEITAELELSDEALHKATSYLSQHGLIGVEKDGVYGGTSFGIEIHKVWLTGDGENFMRELEHRPGMPKRITFKLARALYDTGRDVVVQVLTEYLARRTGGMA